jgi:hypothetical protein
MEWMDCCIILFRTFATMKKKAHLFVCSCNNLYLCIIMRLSPYICELLSQRCKRAIRRSADCEFLTLDIETVTGEHIGVNTMKRLLGFIEDERQPRMSTLDVIAQYLGYDHWETLRVHDEEHSNSDFDENRDEVLVSSLKVGQHVVVSYLPNRRVTMAYMGDNRFRVIESINSKLLAEDVLTLTHLVRNYPMLVSGVVREGQSLGAFTAGKAQGIDFELL